ncbi:unnamed protein product [Cyclocybe aegerita]|uniref:F-box domain-containing protein n=1 Tax=Cyclocybe aegerita TaxID=1973307 RepID=A0A8S0VTG8_CYCAE|nr:unnamed protein product [Cyclocybe aegerita]
MSSEPQEVIPFSRSDVFIRCSTSKGQACQACQCMGLSEIDEQILRLPDRISDLKARRRELKNKINHQHDPLFRNLPPEIVSQVFAEYVEQANFEFESQFDISSKRGWAPPFLLSSVCQLWRLRAIQTPEIWTTINIHLKSRNVPLRVTLAQQLVDYSHQLPLSINIFSNEYVQGHSDLLDILIRCAARWKHLALSVPSRWYQYFSNHVGAAPPQLQSLRLHPCKSEPRIDHVFDMPHTPSLTFLDISQIRFKDIRIQFQNLTHLTLYQIPIHSFLKILECSPLLTTCIARRICDSDGWDDTPLCSPVHLSLTDLHFHPDCSAVLYSFFKQATLPFLQKFTYDGTFYPDSDPDLAACRLFFTRSQCKLTHFTLTNAKLSGIATLLQLLLDQPTITHLSLQFPLDYKCPSITTFFYYLAGSDDAPQTAFLPALQELCLQSQWNFSWNLLPDIFPANPSRSPSSSRVVSGHPSQVNITRPLRTVKLCLFVPFIDTFITRSALRRIVLICRRGFNLRIVNQHGIDLIEEGLEKYASEVSGWGLDVDVDVDDEDETHQRYVSWDLCSGSHRE